MMPYDIWKYPPKPYDTGISIGCSLESKPKRFIATLWLRYIHSRLTL